MGRAPCCSKVGLHRGPWTPREDTLLTKYIQAHGEGHWRSLPKKAGLLRCGKSCRLRWMNYLRPDIKRGNITPDEDDLIIRMHSLLGNRWSLIAGRLPGRTDNEIKNYWNTHLSKKLRTQGTDPNTHKQLSEQSSSLQGNKRRRKNSTASTNKKQNKNNKQKITEPKKHKVHNPKPVRFTSLSSLPRNDSFECNTNSTTLSSSQEGEVGGGVGTTEEVLLDAPYDQSVGFFVGDDNVINGSDFKVCHSHAPETANNNNLEKLYEEYFELLKTDNHEQFELDSFAESLLL